ncbi:hypothetical protein HK102_007951, partial [Quaeritorhiza haematococci]
MLLALNTSTNDNSQLLHSTDTYHTKTTKKITSSTTKNSTTTPALYYNDDHHTPAEPTQLEPLPPLPPPRENLCPRSLNHLQALIRQLLNEAYLDLNTWEKVILDVALQIAQDIPYVLDILGRNPPDDNDTYNSTTSSSNEDVPPLHHVIRTVTDPTRNNPEDSEYIPGPPPDMYPEDVLIVEPRLRELGGTVVLRGTLKDLAKAEKVMDLVIFAVCNLKLEMYLIRDHFAFQPESSSSSLDFASSSLSSPSSSLSPSPSNPRRNNPKKTRPTSLWSWFRALSTSNQNRSSYTSTTNGGEPDDSSDLMEASSNRFDRAIKQIQRTILSSSPDVIFPPPHILIRLRDEEMAQTAAAAAAAETDYHHHHLDHDHSSFPYVSSTSTISGKFNTWGVSSTITASSSSSSSLSPPPSSPTLQQKR